MKTIQIFLAIAALVLCAIAFATNHTKEVPFIFTFSGWFVALGALLRIRD